VKAAAKVFLGVAPADLKPRGNWASRIRIMPSLWTCLSYEISRPARHHVIVKSVCDPPRSLNPARSTKLRQAVWRGRASTGLPFMPLTVNSHAQQSHIRRHRLYDSHTTVKGYDRSVGGNSCHRTPWHFTVPCDQRLSALNAPGGGQVEIGTGANRGGGAPLSSRKV